MNEEALLRLWAQAIDAKARAAKLPSRSEFLEFVKRRQRTRIRPLRL